MKAITLMLSIFAFTMAFAQGGQKAEQVKKTPEERAKAVTTRMTEKLSLSTEQQSKVSTINLTYAQKHQTIRENTALSKDEKKTQLEASKTALMAEYKSILTDEQYKKLEEIKAKHEERKANGKPPKGASKTPNKNLEAPEEEL